jgi:thiosulfate/3-mercaptopyruvate sulfurtransferase
MSSTTLVTVEQLKQHAQDPDWCIVDCRHDLFDHALGRREYDAGHITGAFFADIENDLSGPKTGKNGRHPLPSREKLVELFRGWGVTNRTQFVAYDAQGSQFAVRLWWLARWLGHDGVAVLDGGWQAWVAASGPTDREVPTRPRGTFEAGAPLAKYVDAAFVRDHIGDKRSTLLDARAAERYAGEQEPIDPVAGHIPGALNRFWQLNLTDGKFKSPAELRAEYEALLAGKSPSEVVHQCGSGVTSCHSVLAMEIAGLPGSQLYAGSWSEWIATSGARAEPLTGR